MKFWNQYPLYRLLIPLLLGIIVGNNYIDFNLPISFLIIVFVLLAAWIFRPSRFHKYSWRHISGLLINILFFLFGYQLVMVNTTIKQNIHYSHFDSVSYITISINSPLIEKNKTYKTVGKVKALYRNSDTVALAASGKVLLYFSKENFPGLQYGDELIISNKLEPIKGYGNPHEFNYKKYLEKQNIYHQCYLTRTNWVNTHHGSPSTFKKWSLKIRGTLLDILKSFHFDEPEFAVASAILLGNDEYLDSDLRQLYAGSGAMHILCVSGLHVGIIFLIFNALLAFLKKSPYGRALYAISIISIIWIYAIITGLSPSVTRAATMFSFITVGSLMNRKTSTYNSLAASAFVILIINPYLLFHIGFQLSYIAVLSIIFLQPHLSRLYRTKYYLTQKIRDLITVSIAAQLGTFPLAIYYFHQFPNYFILTNLIVIPLSFFILIAGFSSIAVSLLGIGSSMIGWIATKSLYYSLLLLNSAINIINKLPLAVSSDLYFTKLDTPLVYSIIIFISLFFIIKKYRFLTYAILSSIILFGTNIYFKYSTTIDQSLSIYNIPKHSLIELSCGNKCVIISDSLLKEDTASMERYIHNNHLHKRIKQQLISTFNAMSHIQFKDYLIRDHIIVFNEKKLLIIDEQNLLPKSTGKIKFDYVLLRNNPKIDIQVLDSLINLEFLIIDASNNYSNHYKWNKQCDLLGIQHWDTQEKGAFVLHASIQ